MTRQDKGDRGRNMGAAAMAAALALSLAACTALQDDPEIPGADRPYPNLATVPERPEPTTSAAERRALVGELTQARDSARRTDRKIRAETAKQ